MLKKMFSWMAVLAIVVGVGVPPTSSYSAAQSKLLARRAALVNVYRQTKGAPFHIMDEVWNGSQYTVYGEI